MTEEEQKNILNPSTEKTEKTSKNKKERSIKSNILILIILLILSIFYIKNILGLPRASFSSPEMPGRLMIPIMIWASTIWVGLKLYKKIKLGKHK